MNTIIYLNNSPSKSSLRFFFKSLCIFVHMSQNLKTIFGSIFLLIFVSCKENHTSNEGVQNGKELGTTEEIPSSLKKDFTKYLTHTLQNAFEVGQGENYTTNFLEVDYDRDGIMDKIISINRLEKANSDLESAENPEKFMEIGQMGNYNHLILYNGRDSLFYDPVNVSSSPYVPLVVSSISLKGGASSEIQVDYRIRNSSYRSLYSIKGNQVRLIFHWKIFDGLGTNSPEAYAIEVGAEGKYGEFKDLNIYKGKLEILPTNSNPNTFQPKITKTGRIYTTFFYIAKEEKYFTKLKNQFDHK